MPAEWPAIAHRRRILSSITINANNNKINGTLSHQNRSKNETEEAKSNMRYLAFECHQLPRSSDYPKNAATGIAAGALVAGLHHCQIMPNNKEHRGVVRGSNYDVFQGTAVGQPSKIRVKIGDYASKETNPSLNAKHALAVGSPTSRVCLTSRAITVTSMSRRYVGTLIQ